MTYNTLIMGAPSTGKSTVLINRILEAIKADVPVILLAEDWVVDEVAHRTPPEYWDITTVLDLTYKNPTPLTLPTDPTVFREVLRDTAKYKNASTPVFDRLVFYLASSTHSILDMKAVLLNNTFRAKLSNKLTDPIVKSFWLGEYDKWDHRKREDRIQSTLNQLDVFLTDLHLRHTFCYPHAQTTLKDNVLIKVPSRAAGIMLLALVSKRHHVFIDDAERYDGQVLQRTLSDIRTTLTLTTVQDMNYALNSTGEKVVLRLGGFDADRMTKVMRIPEMAMQLTELQDFDAYRVAPGQNAKKYHLPPIEHRTFSQAPKALRSNRQFVPLRRVKKAIRETVERNLV